MYQSLTTSKKYEVAKKISAAFMILSLNLSVLGVGAVALPNTALAVDVLSCDPSVNLIQNAGFEAPVVESGSSSIFETGAAGLAWLVDWASALTQGIPGLEIQNHAPALPSEGNQHAELDSAHPVKIWQIPATVIGQEYELTFDHSPRGGTNVTDNSMSVLLNDASFLTIASELLTGTESSSTWTHYGKRFTASTDTTKVEFIDTGVDNGTGNYLDNVTLHCVNAPALESTYEACTDTLDNDGDSKTDLLDDDCVNYRPTIHVVKDLINNDGGTGTLSNFNYHWQLAGVEKDFTIPEAGDPSHGSRELTYTNGGTYAITEAPATGYTTTYSEGCTGELAVAAYATCVITNDDIAGNGGGTGSQEMSITVIKHVVNNNGGGKSAGDFSLHVNLPVVPPTCETGFHLDGESCVADTPVPPTCESGFHIDGDSCVADAPVTPTCETGFHLDGDSCVADTPVPPTCESGFHLDGNSCVEDTPPLVCPIGFHLNGLVCDQDPILEALIKWFTPVTAFADVAQVFAPATFSGDEEGTTIYFHEATDYTVTEDADGLYATTYGEGCTGHIAAGEHKTCVVTNDDIQQQVSGPGDGGTGGGSGGGSSTFDYYGCTNKDASNYNSLANKDDGSCKTTGGGGSNGGGGSEGSNGATGGGNGGGGAGAPAGEVLGEATSTPDLPLPPACAANPYLRDFLKMGKKNDADQVKLLQSFLNDKAGASLPVSGIFGTLTKKAVKKFQKDNHAMILQPWIDAGFKGNINDGTGYVYKTTKRAINMMMCEAVTVPMPDLTPDL